MTKKKSQEAAKGVHSSSSWFGEYINTTLLPLLTWAVYWIETGLVVFILELSFQKEALADNETLLLAKGLFLLAIAPLPLVGVPVLLWYRKTAVRR